MKHITFKFHPIYCIATGLLFLIEVLIAMHLKTGFIRHTVGDFLVVLLLFCFFKSFLKIETTLLAMLTLVIAYVIEFLQLTNFLNLIGLADNKWARIIFGTSFSTQDLVAYTLGIILILGIDRCRFSKKKLL